MAPGTVTMACLLLAASVAAPPEPSYMQDRGFQIPLRIDEDRRAEIRQIVLFVSKNGGSTWEQAGAAAPDKDGFAFNAPSDGVYLFKLQVEGADGSREPADIYKAEVSRKIIVDTLRPQLQITMAEPVGDELIVRWEARDENPNLASLKLEYRTAEMPPDLWNPVSLTPGMVGQARFRPAGNGALSLRMQMTDLATNLGTATLELPARPAAGNTSLAPPAGNSAGAVFPPPGASAAGGWSPTQGGAPIHPVSNPSRIKAADSAEPSRPLPRASADPFDTVAGGGAPSLTAGPGPAFPTAPAGQQLVASTANALPAAPTPGPMAPRQPRGNLPRLQIINCRRVTMEYEVAKYGPSGVGNVELYLTRDDGQKWERCNVDPAANVPVSGDLVPGQTMRRALTVELPGEGRYGFYLVVKSGVGRGKPGPRDGDAPQMLVELDETAPEANLYAPEPDPRDRQALVLRWQASDHNLTPNPVTLQWAEHKEGPWESIAGDLPNVPSQFSWKLTPRVPPRVFLRLVVKDTAGNIARAETPEPILVDLNEPEAQFISLTGAKDH